MGIVLVSLMLTLNMSFPTGLESSLLLWECFHRLWYSRVSNNRGFGISRGLEIFLEVNKRGLGWKLFLKMLVLERTVLYASLSRFSQQIRTVCQPFNAWRSDVPTAALTFTEINFSQWNNKLWTSGFKRLWKGTPISLKLYFLPQSYVFSNEHHSMWQFKVLVWFIKGKPERNTQWRTVQSKYVHFS